MATFLNTLFQPSWNPGEDETKVRTIGLEIEARISNQDCLLYRENLEKFLHPREGTYRDMSEVYNELKIRDCIPAFGFDGDELEFVTHPDSISYYIGGGSSRFKKAMKFLKQNAKGGKDATNSGTHINVAKLPHEDVEYTMDNAYWLCMNFANQIQKIAGRITHWASFAPYSYGEIFRLDTESENIYEIRSKKADTVLRAPKAGAKATCLVEKPKVYEFRLFKSTTDINEALAWVELCYNIINIGSGAIEIDNVTFQDLIKGEHIRKYVANLKGKRKLTKQELNATVKNTLSFTSLSSVSTIIL